MRPPSTLASPSVAESRLLALVFTELTDSVELRGRIGDSASGELIRRHFALVRTLTSAENGHEVVNTGEGFFLVFEAPSAAVAFALRLQRAHRDNPELPRARVGLHLGEVTVRPPAPGSSEPIVDGFAADLASRVASLAMPGQVLLTHSVFDNARQRLDGDRLGLAGNLAWRTHGRYIFKGHDRPVAIFEVGEEDGAPLVPPADSDKARRVSDHADGGPPLWKPAVGAEIPHRPNWILERRLGAGGFGEVWVAGQPRSGEHRVYKFCHDRERLPSLKREASLFRLLRDALGDREDIGRILDWQFEEEPFHLELEYAGDNNLAEWFLARGGAASVPLEVRVAIVCRVADAVGAAHSVGVLHKDIKPSNVMVASRLTEPGVPKIRVIDFGLAAILDRQAFLKLGITAPDATRPGSSHTETAGGGTRIYMAPELMEGRPATTRADVYALGVMLYQAVIGDFAKALADGWQRDVNDWLLRIDIGACVDGDPERRPGTALEVARRLRALDERRRENDAAEADRHAADLAMRALARTRRRVTRAFAGTALALALLAGASYVALRESKLRRDEAVLRKSEQAAKAQAVAGQREAALKQAAAEAARREADIQTHRAEAEQYATAIGFADAYLREGRVRKARELLLGGTPPYLRRWEWGRLMAASDPTQMILSRHRDPAAGLHAAFDPSGTRIATGDNSGQVRVYSADRGRLLVESTVHTMGVWSVSFSPDGRRLLTTSFDRTAAILDASTLTPIHRLAGHRGLLRGGAWSHDGTMVATTSADNTAKVWNAATGQPLATLSGHGNGVYAVDFASTGGLMATAGKDGTVRFWDTATFAPAGAPVKHPENVLSVGFSPDGTRVATACTDGRIRVISAPGGTLLRERSVAGRASGQPGFEETAIVHSSAFSPDGTSIATTDDTGNLSILDSDTLATSITFRGDFQMYKAAWSPDGARLATASSEACAVWDIAAARRAKALSLDTALSSPAFLSSSTAEAVRVACMPTERGNTWPNYEKPWNTGSGRTLLAGDRRNYSVGSYFRVFPPDALSAVTTGSLAGKRPAGPSIAIDPVTLVASATRADGKEAPLSGPGGETVVGYDAAFSDDASLAAVGSSSGKFYIYAIPGFACRAAVRHPVSTAEVECVRFAPDGALLFAGFHDGSALLVETTSGVIRRQWAAHARGIRAAAFSPDGRSLATASLDTTSKVWNLATGDLTATLTGHTNPVIGISYHPDGDRILTFSTDFSVRLFDSADGRELLTVFRRSINDIVPVAATFTRDGADVWCASAGRLIRTAPAFPWRAENLPGAPADGTERRLELYKRRLRLDPATALSDIAW